MKKNAGLTLLELLVAMAVLSVVTIMVYVSLSSVIDGVEAAREETSISRVRNFLSWNLQRNFAGAYIHPVYASEGLFYFRGDDEGSAQDPKDRLEFFSTTMVVGGGALPGELKRIVIELVDEEDDTDLFTVDQSEAEESAPADAPKRFLQVVETPVSSAEMGDMSDADGFGSSFDSGADAGEGEATVPSWTVPVDTFNVTYYDGLSDKWADEWDTDEQQRLPWAVDIKINFPKTEDAKQVEQELGIDPLEHPDIRLIIPLPTAMGVASLPQDVLEFDGRMIQNNRGGGRGGGINGPDGNTNGNNTNNSGNNAGRGGNNASGGNFGGGSGGGNSTGAPGGNSRRRVQSN
jgi:prepilin-type N-terminal cleavage/methylation domain-containing protein